MKTLRLLFIVVGIMLAFLTFSSCLDDDDAYSLGDMWYSVATAQPIDGDGFYLMLDGGTTLYPAAPLYIGYQPKRPQRVQANYTIIGDNWSGYDHAIKLNRIDTILTKSIAENLGTENDSIYGKDPIGIDYMWVGDGYLNLIFKANFTPGKKNFVNLIQEDTTAASPYKLEFRHNTYGGGTYGSYGIVAFDLSSLPDTEGQDVTLEIRVKTFDGEQVIEKKYNSKKNTEKETKLDMKSFENMLE